MGTERVVSISIDSSHRNGYRELPCAIKVLFFIWYAMLYFASVSCFITHFSIIIQAYLFHICKHFSNQQNYKRLFFKSLDIISIFFFFLHRCFIHFFQKSENYLKYLIILILFSQSKVYFLGLNFVRKFLELKRTDLTYLLYCIVVDM